MKYIKKFEIFFGSAITKALKFDIFKNMFGRTDLMMSIIENDMLAFKKLLKNNVNLEEKDNDNNTALIIASEKGRLKMVKYLILNGADIHSKNNNSKDFYDVANNELKTWIEKKFPEFIISKKYNL